MHTGSNRVSSIRTLSMFGPVPTRVTAIELPPTDDSDVQTHITVEEMAHNIASTVYSKPVGKAVSRALSGMCGANPGEREKANAIFNWVKRNVRFVRDSSILEGIGIRGVDEALIAPDRLLTMPKPQGDCDDFTQVASAMLWRAGIRNSIITIAADKSDPHLFSHVYNQVDTEEGQTVAFDSSHGPRMGWEAPRYFRKKVWKVMPYKGNLDQQVINGVANQRFYQRRMLDPVSQQVIKAIPGFSGLGDTTTLDTPWSGGDVWGSSGGGVNWGSSILNIANIFAKPLATAVSASIMPSGSMLQQTPQGSVLVTGASGQPYGGGYPTGINLGGSSIGTLLLLGGGGLLLIMVLGSLNK